MNKERRIQLVEVGRGRQATSRVLLGEIRWSCGGGLQYAVADKRLSRALKTAIARQVRRRAYYVAAAVRRGIRVEGLRLDTVNEGMPEILRCISVDTELWGREHAGYRVAAKYREGLVR